MEGIEIAHSSLAIYLPSLHSRLYLGDCYCLVKGIKAGGGGAAAAAWG